mgnify:FL=1
MVTEFQGRVIDALNSSDAQNKNLLENVINAASEISLQNGGTDVAGTDGRAGTQDDHGMIRWGGKFASLTGTGGVALLEYAKDTIQTSVSNISGAGTNEIQARKIVERKVSGNG